MARIPASSREAGIRELGEDTVRAAEVEVVQAHADRLSVATFPSKGIPAASSLEGLGLDAEVSSPGPGVGR
jgi:hypothetical protein